MTTKTDYIIGIDLGTTNSAFAIYRNNDAEILENSEGARTTPSMVAYSDNGKRVDVGITAKRQALTNKNTIFGAKRFIGRQYSEVESYVKMVPYNVVKRDNGEVGIKVGEDTVVTPQEIGAKVLRKIVDDAEKIVGQKIRKAVITVPAYFNDSQRQATKDAGRIAGLEVERIINEPTAAALAYGMDKKVSGTIIVYDLGGGTFDVSVLHVEDGVVEVQATNGDTLLGGEDFDQALIEYVAAEFKKTNGVDLMQDVSSRQRLKEACEEAKKNLSSSTEAEINLPYITATASGPLHLLQKITRAKFESLVEDLVQKTLEPCRKAIKDAGIDTSEIKEVILVGGMTRMPRVRQVVQDFFKKTPTQSINPDEVVAMGAAVQGGVLQGTVSGVLLLDVTPLSLGIETMGGVMDILIPRNTTIPTEKSRVYSTAADNQTEVTIRVFQGEREMATHNKLLGQFNLTGIPAAPRGVPQIEVTFDLDANGILSVKAKDKNTGKEQTIVIKDSGGLSEDEIQQAIKDAEMHAEEDKKEKEIAEKINQTDQIISATEKALKEHGDKISEDEKSKINAEIEELKKASAARDMDAIEKHAKALGEASENLTKIAYEASKAESGQDASNDQTAENAKKAHDVAEDVTDV